MARKKKQVGYRGRPATKVTGLRGTAKRSQSLGALATDGFRETTEQRIIDGTIDALCRQGFRGLTTRRIAEAAGVRLATLHYHFKDKDALLVSVIDTITSRIAAALRNDVRPSEDLMQSIDAILDSGWRFVLSSRELNIVQFELICYALRTRGVEWLARRQYRDYLKTYEQVFGAHARNTRPAKTFIGDLARLVLAGLDGIILQELVEPDAERSARAIRLLAEAAKALAGARRHDLLLS